MYPVAERGDGLFADGPYRRDEMILTDNLVLFSEPVWRQVLCKLGDKDVDNCGNSSIYLLSLDQKRRERKLSEAIPIVFSFLWKLNRRRHENETEAAALKFLLTCRFISKKVNSAIECLFQSARQATNFLNASGNTELVVFSQDTFARMVDVRVFESWFGDTHYNESDNMATKNPFLGASVRIIVSSEMFVEGIVGLLEKYGHFIQNMEVVLVEDYLGGNRLEGYHQLMRLMALIPHVAYFTLRQASDHSMDDGERGGGHRLDIRPFGNLNFLTEMESAIALMPFPILQNLQYLEAHQVDSPILDAILLNNPNILSLQYTRTFFSGNYGVFNGHMQNLRVLKVKMDSVSTFSQFENCCFPQLDCLVMAFDFRAPWNPLSRLIYAVNKNMNANLVELGIALSPVSVSMYRTTPKLNLKNLRRFSITTGSPVELDFLLLCNAIEIIDVVKTVPGIFDTLLGRFPIWSDIQPESLGKQFVGLKKLRITHLGGSGQPQIYHYMKNREAIFHNYGEEEERAE